MKTTPHDQLIAELKEIVWSINAKFDENRTWDSDYYAQAILSAVAEAISKEVIGEDEPKHIDVKLYDGRPGYKNNPIGRTRNKLRVTQRKALTNLLKGGQ